MDLFERILNTIFSIVITVFLVGLMCFFIPRWILGWDFHLFPLEIGVFRFIGLVPLILGIVTMLGFIWGWILSGTGTPLQFDTPKELIVRGSYRFVRNPMYVGYFLILFGEVLLFESSVLLVYFLVFFLFPIFFFYRTLKNMYCSSYEEDLSSQTEVQTIPFINAIFLASLRLERLLIKHLNLPLGTSLVAIARK